MKQTEWVNLRLDWMPVAWVERVHKAGKTGWDTIIGPRGVFGDDRPRLV